jgi:enterochelin esterase-like enzyme
MKTKLGIVTVLTCAALAAQITQRVNPDLSVTYFVNAPDAKDVRLADSVFSLGPPGLALTKGSDGIWSVTTPPYEPGTHRYGFVLDGVITGDFWDTAPKDRLPRGHFPFELIDVRGSQPLFHDLQQVPHGVVHIETFSSPLFGRDVRCFVYTPPGYEASSRQYPALYLLHGLGDQPDTWTDFGYADRIVDNFIAAGKGRDLIVVMPDTGAANRANQPLDLVEHYMLEELIPFAEKKYRIDPSPAARYLAGFSAGANHVRNIGFLHPDLFSALGMMSGGGFGPAAPQLETTYPILTDAAAFNAQIKFVYIAIGREDASSVNALTNVQRLKDSLDRLGIPSTYNISSGGHELFNWRRYLLEFLQGLPQ